VSRACGITMNQGDQKEPEYADDSWLAWLTFDSLPRQHNAAVASRSAASVPTMEPSQKWRIQYRLTLDLKNSRPLIFFNLSQKGDACRFPARSGISSDHPRSSKLP
jgi:hypothetical protein